MHTRIAAAFLVLSAVATVPRAHGAEATRADAFWEFYERYPQFQDFFPFGVYGGPGNWSPFGQSPKVFNQLIFDTLRENYLNAIWGTATARNVAFDGKTPRLTDFGRWYYDEMRWYEFKILPTLQPWLGQSYSNSVFYKLAKLRKTAPLTPGDVAQAQRELKPVLDWAAEFGREYSDLVLGGISDDEPGQPHAASAAVRLIAEHTGKPATTCIPSWGAFKVFAAHLQPITGDWYPTGDMIRDSWSVARNLRWLHKHHPDRVFWFIPLVSAYDGGHEPTKPGLRDARPLRTELRLQVWQAVAWGCKGFFFYNVGGWIDWAHGEDNLLNPLLQANTHNLLAELHGLGRELTAIGPLLLSCRPETSLAVPAYSGRVRYPEFEGPAIEVGLLKDIRHDRYFLVPYNNDIDRRRGAAVAVPAKLLATRQVYDLHRLKKVDLDEKRMLHVGLEPGGGRVFPPAAPAESAKCRDAILRHRASNARVLCKVRLRVAEANRVKLDDARKLLTEAGAAEKRKDWLAASTTYADAAAAIHKATHAGRFLRPTLHMLGRVARVLSETDDLLRTHVRVLKLPDHSQHLHFAHVQDKYIGREIRQWMTLAQCYYDAQARVRSGRLGGMRFYDYLCDVHEWAKQNRDAIQAKIDRRLAERRKPFRLALVTADRHDVENVQLYSWAFENCRVTWVAPDAKGQLADDKGKPFRPADYDVVWIHQLRYAQVPKEGEKPDPARVLLPALAAKPMRDAMVQHVERGGGLLLSGIAGLYAMSLGIEKTPPDRVRENGLLRTVLGVGLVAAPGFAKHPAFTGLAPDGFFTNGNWYLQNLVAECAWKTRRPSGLVVANLTDVTTGPDTGYAAMVEYRHGKGKVIVFGGVCCDLNPGIGHSLPKGNHRHDLRDRMRQFALNTLGYLAGRDTFAPDQEAIRKARAAPKTVIRFLPFDGWLFRTDPKNVGARGKWFLPTHDAAGWQRIRVDQSWEQQGYDYDGTGWYRLTFTAANQPGMRTLLHFGAVDETAVVWLDGRLVGKHDEGLEGWNKPFALDITKFLTAKPATHLLVVQAHDEMAAGGIWRPVSIRHVKTRE